MPIDAPVLAGIAQELRCLLPLKIDKIYQPYPDEILFSSFGSGVSCKILISLHQQYGRITLFEGDRDNPPQPSAFCMLLRKHFGGAKLIDIATVPFERICRLTFEAYDPYQGLSKKNLWLELTGKNSNLIITNIENVILDAWHKSGPTKNSGRELAAGVKYEFPGAGGRWKPVTLSWEQFFDLVSNIPPDIPLEKFLLKHWFGLSAITIHELARPAGLFSATPCGDIPATTMKKLYGYFVDWSEAVSLERFEPSCLCDRNGKARDCSAFSIHYPPDDYLVQKIDSLNRIVSEIMENHLESYRFELLTHNLLHLVKKRLDKAQIKLAKQETEADTAEQGDSYRIRGELLMTYSNQIKKGATEVRLVNHYDPQNAEILIPINPALTARENAQHYFKKYQKAKKGRQAIAVQLKKTMETIEYFESVETLIQNAINSADLKLVQLELENEERVPVSNQANKSKKEPAAEPRRYTTPEGDLILVGRNNLQNDRLTFKIAGPNDLWFHTQKIPGSHVILKLKPGNTPTDQTLNYACQLAAYFSKAKQSTKIPVDYTHRKYVNKPPGAKPGFVIYDFFKTAIITPDQELIKQLKVESQKF